MTAAAARTAFAVPLDGSGWSVWRDCVLRGAGFPTSLVRPLSEPALGRLAARADAAEPDAGFIEAYRGAVVRQSHVLAAIAADRRFLEAVTWQNPTMVRAWLGRFAADGGVGDRPRRKQDRKHELAVASYAQRYATKNDTIGFFGPVAWAVWARQGPAVELKHGPAALSRRTVYFESWAVDGLAMALSEDLELAPWVCPRLVAGYLLADSVLHPPYGRPIALTARQAALLAGCDGNRSVRTLADVATADGRWLGGTEQVGAQLAAWRDDGVIHLDFRGPIEAYPERTLRSKLARVADPESRERALAGLAEMVAARDAVAAADDPERLLAAVEGLARTFERLTGRAATRRPGEAYAGRTLVYEDAVRGLSARLGPPLMAAIAEPLALLLTSARWLLGRVAELYHAELLESYERLRPGTGGAAVPFPALLARAAALLASRGGPPPTPVAQAVAEMQERWRSILCVPPDVRRHTVSAASIAAAVAAAFPPAGLRWAAAVHYTLDLMIADAGVEALDRENFSVVLGELHLATNALESRPFVEQHPEPARLAAAMRADHAGRRVYPVPAKEMPRVSSRTYPSALLTDDADYWCLFSDTAGAPGPVLPAAGLSVHRVGDQLVVGAADDREFTLLEAIGELLSAVVVDAFQPLPPAPRRPRVAIDRLVFQRAAWTFDATTVTWAFARSDAERFWMAQRWRRRHGVPARAFYRLPAQRKPMYVDFDSVVLVELLGKGIRGAAGAVEVVEMLPDLDQTWLTDVQGASYTAELRMVVVDPDANAAHRSGRP